MSIIMFIYFFLFAVYQEVNDSGIVTLNCIIAKQVCIDDPLCGPTLDIVDRVCGSEVGKSFHQIQYSPSIWHKLEGKVRM